MSHERSTSPSPSSTEYAHATTSQFARTPSGFMRDRNGPITAMERFAMGRSDASFNTIAGAVGGFASGVVSCPLDVIKTKLQAQGGFRAKAAASNASGQVVYKGMLGTARVIWREEGIRGMYRGLGPIILGYLPTWAVWFTVYGKSKDYFSKTNGMHVMCFKRTKLTRSRQSIRCQFLVIDSCRRILNDGHKPDMGYKNSTDVAS